MASSSRARASGDLLRLSHTGNREALDELLRRHLPGLRAFARVRMGELLRAHDSSSDIVQSACIALLQNAGDFEYRGEAAFRAWLFQTVTNKIRQHERFLTEQKRDVRRKAPAGAAAERASTDDHTLSAIYADVLSPSQELIAAEDLRVMEQALETLPDDYREVIALSRIAQLPRSEVARQMERTEDSVRNLLPRALVALASAMDRRPRSAD